MAKGDRKYKIEMVLTGNPPKPEPKLKNNQGQPMPPQDPIVFNKSNDNMKKVDHYRIRFELDNPNQTNLRFLRSKADVMWCHEAPICPDSFCEMPGVFWVDEIDQAGEWIDVINMDLVPQQFRFTLNFADKNITNPTPADYVALDPIIGNENRGSAGSESLSMLIPIGVGLCAGLAAFLGAELLLT